MYVSDIFTHQYFFYVAFLCSYGCSKIELIFIGVIKFGRLNNRTIKMYFEFCIRDVIVKPNHTVFEWERSCVDFMDVIMGDECMSASMSEHEAVGYW